MALVVLSIDERKLPAHTRDEFEEWVRFCVGDRSDIQNANPLSDLDLQATVREISWFKASTPNVRVQRGRKASAGT